MVSNHAAAVLTRDFPSPLQELCSTLLNISINCSELIKGGGGEALSTQRLRHALSARGWVKRKVVIRKIVDDQEKASTTHEIDHVRDDDKGAIALEIEWNNKDPFFDRDLENFQRLHAEGAISVGIVVTRGASLQERMTEIVHNCAQAHGVTGWGNLRDFGVTPTSRQRSMVNRNMATGRSFLEAWAKAFVNDKFGSTTTHWVKLQERVSRGVGNPCPLLLIGIPASVVVQPRED